MAAAHFGARIAGPTGSVRTRRLAVLLGKIRATGLRLGPGPAFLAGLLATFLLAMFLVLQIQLQAQRIATVDELERDLARAQNVQLGLTAKAATASNLIEIEQRALELGMVEPTAESVTIIANPPPVGFSDPEWRDPAPPTLTKWHQRIWQSAGQFLNSAFRSALGE